MRSNWAITSDSRAIPIVYVTFVLLFKEAMLRVEYDDVVLKYYAARKDWKTSNLGTYLFKNIGLDGEPKFVPKKHKSFFILQWLKWGYDYKQSVYTLQGIPNPLEDCSVKNCIFSDDTNDIDMADAVVINIRHTDINLPQGRRLPGQLWIWMSEESPPYNNLTSVLPDLANIYNWSMSYRTDSEIPMPYGRTLPRPMKVIEDVTNEEYLVELVPNWNRKRRDVIAAVLMSHCSSKYRNEYLKELRKYITVDFYGYCSDDNKLKCKCIDEGKAHFKTDCPYLDHYLFYLVFENARCRQYLSEKSFYHAFSKGAIPVIMGPPQHDCETLLPPNSYLHVGMFESPEELANHMKGIVLYNDTVLWYHRWRNLFKTVNEHGYFGSPSLPLCRICEALNYNDKHDTVYSEDDLRLFLESKILCEPPFEGM